MTPPPVQISRLTNGEWVPLDLTTPTPVDPPPPVESTMLIGARYKSIKGGQTQAQLADDYLVAHRTIGPLAATRVFEGSLPAKWVPITPDGHLEVVSFKSASAANMRSYIGSMRPGTKLVFHHEPEGPTDFTSGAAYVSEFNQYADMVHGIDPTVEIGQIAGGFQWRDGKNGADGSYLPPPSKCDFYCFDSYRDGTAGTFGEIVPLEQVDEFQNWLSFVKDRGRPLGLTEYGRGVVDMNEIPSTPQDRVRAFNADYPYLKDLGFFCWICWWCNVGPDGRSWKFHDTGSIQAWKNICLAEGQTA